MKNIRAEIGSRFILEVEVGSWPLPEITWFRNDDEIFCHVFSENYNGFFNKYVPEKKIDVSF